MENQTFPIATNASGLSPDEDSRINWQKILLGVILYVVVVITVAGNSLVLIAVYREKKLQTVFNLYIVNLAITDIGVAVTAMSFYTIDNILGYWPFGEIMCGLWIFCDYGMTFASVFTLIVISIDRFWSVYWSVHYRANHNKKKSVVAIITVWCVMVALWLPACITDRIKNAEPYVCIWEPSLNPEYVYIIALVGHHGSCFILLYCYLQVFFFMRKRAKVGPVAKKALPDRSIAETSVGVTEIPSSNKQTIQTTHQASIDKRKPEDREAMAEKRERKVFVTLSYILFGYIICWVPFHIVFDISAFDPSLVPEVVFTITFWMTYLNSTLNPFLYNFSSPDFKIAFKKILTRK